MEAAPHTIDPMTIQEDVRSGRHTSVANFVKIGGDVELRDALGQTLLHIAAVGGQTAIAELLLNNGSDPNARTAKAFTPLHLAAAVGAADVVVTLLEAGADAAAENVYGNTPLHEIAGGGGVAEANTRLAIVDRLLAAGAPLEAGDSAGRSALWFAAATGTTAIPDSVRDARLAVIAALLTYGADPTRRARGELGTPMDAARGLHQRRQHRIVWPEALELLERAAAQRR